VDAFTERMGRMDIHFDVFFSFYLLHTNIMKCQPREIFSIILNCLFHDAYKIFKKVIFIHTDYGEFTYLIDSI